MWSVFSFMSSPCVANSHCDLYSYAERGSKGKSREHWANSEISVFLHFSRLSQLNDAWKEPDRCQTYGVYKKSQTFGLNSQMLSRFVIEI